MKKFIFVISLLFIPYTVWAYEIFPVQVSDNNELVFSVDAKNAQSVAIAGNFNDWSADKNMLKKDELGVWSINLKLQDGEYEYKFVLNGNKWIPDNNLKVTVISRYGKIKIKGGAGYAQKFEKRANLGKLNDKIFIKGLYKFILINSVYNSTVESVDNRHILDITPEIYFSDSVYGDFTLNIDSSKADYLNYWKGILKLYTDYTAFYLFNNVALLNFRDPLQTMNRYRLNSGYPVFKYPMTFYNSDNINQFAGRNLRGAEFRVKYNKLTGDFVLFRPNYKNFTVGSYLINYNFESSRIGIMWLRERGLYEGNDYVEPSDSGFAPSPFDSNTYFFLDTSKYYSISKNYDIIKVGPLFHLQLNKSIAVFGEFLYSKKTGGFFAKTLYSDGHDLPSDYSNYPSSGSYNYDKFVHFFENEFTEKDFIIGTHVIGKVYKHELSFKVNSKEFKSVPTYNMRYITPASSVIKYLSFFDFNVKSIRFGIVNEVSIMVNDKNVDNYNYYVAFDRNNFYNQYLAGVYNNIKIRNKINIALNNPLRFGFDFIYNKYMQRDIYFGTGKEWNSETFESYFKSFYNYSTKWNFELSLRFKYYSYFDMVEKNIMLDFKKLYITPFIKIGYNVFGNFNLYFEYGLDPEIDEEHSDGMQYYLNSKLDNRFPFFKTAEDSLMNNQFIGIKAALRF